jgi:hypothetical protein
MTDDTTRGPGGVPEPGELQLRKALSAMNDLEPPRDDLFAQRALMRGRARTSRRRSTLLGAAAAVLVVGAAGGTWVAATQGSSADSASSGTAARSAAGSSAGSGASESLRGAAPPAAPGAAPSVPSAQDTTRWFGTLSTRQTNAFDAIEPAVATRWPDVFSGAYAVTPTGDRVAVAVTWHDPALETFVAGAMPARTDVEFVIRSHPFTEKQRIERKIVAERNLWRDKGVDVVSVAQDGRADQVVVVVAEGSDSAMVTQRYGDVVRVVLASPSSSGKLPDGRTLPPLQR